MYGTVPIVRSHGGLRRYILDVTANPDKGTVSPLRSTLQRHCRCDYQGTRILSEAPELEEIAVARHEPGFSWQKSARGTLKFINWLSRRPNPGVERAATDRICDLALVTQRNLTSQPAPATRVSALRKSQSYTHPINGFTPQGRRWRFHQPCDFLISSINVQVRFPASAWTGIS